MQRLFDENRAAGYAGSYGRVRDYVRTVRPRDPVEPANRFETPPGRQGQVDFGSFMLPWGRRHALLVVLGHSRILWLRFYPRQTMAVLIDAPVLVRYVRALGKATAAGAMGFWLEREQKRLGVPGAALEELRTLMPAQPRYALGARPGAGRQLGTGTSFSPSTSSNAASRGC